MEILLVRFTKAQRAAIRKAAKIQRKSEAEIVRICVEQAITRSRVRESLFV